LSLDATLALEGMRTCARLVAASQHERRTFSDYVRLRVDSYQNALFPLPPAAAPSDRY
jgi:hypothetical protein